MAFYKYGDNHLQKNAKKIAKENPHKQITPKFMLLVVLPNSETHNFNNLLL